MSTITAYLVQVVLLFHCTTKSDGYGALFGRRRILHLSFVSLSAPSAVLSSNTDPRIESLEDAQSTLELLLNNWEKATVDCTFADVPRDLLESKNKELLLEKASTFALFDKSVSVETCKTTNRVVRNYLGVNGNGPLVGIDKKVVKALDLVDPDFLEDYLNEAEEFSQRISRAVSLSYTAGTADFDSVNNFSKDDRDRKEDSNLEQSRQAIEGAKTSLDRMLGMFGAE